MSLDSVRARIAELTGLVAAPAPPPAAATAAVAAPGSTPAVVFLGSLQNALQRGTATAATSVYEPQIETAASRYGVDPALVRAVVKQESGFNPNATSQTGAAGLMQLMPDTARSLGVTDPYDPGQSVDAGTRYLADQLQHFGGDLRLALAAYNAGPGAVARYGGVPPYAETQAYVDQVLTTYQSYVGGAAA